MDEYVWVSNALNAEASLSIAARGMLAEGSPPEAGQGMWANKDGRPVAQECCAVRFWSMDEGDEYSRPIRVETGLPDLFVVGEHWIVSERAADIMRQFDLGGGALYPVSEGIYHSDNETRHPGNFYTWVFGNVKSTFVGAESKNLRKPKIEGLWWKLAYEPADGDVAVGQAALSGPDVWLDQMLFKSIFLSRDLGDALVAAGLREPFYLNEARVI